MTTIIWVTGLSVGVLGVTACSPAGLPGRPAAPGEIAGRSLISQSVRSGNQNVPLVGTPSQPRGALTLKIYPVGLSASGGCNHYSIDAWEIVDGHLSPYGNLSRTIIACSRTQDAQDDWFYRFLKTTPEINVDGTTVWMEAGDVRISFADATP